MNKLSTLQKTFIYIFLASVVLVTVLPFYWNLVSSFKPQREIFERPSIVIKTFTLDNYKDLLFDTNYPRWIFNSLFVAICFTVLVVFFCSLGGLGFAKYSFRGRDTLFLILLGSMAIPMWAIAIPLFIWFSRLRMIDTYWALILPGCASAFGIFLMRQYIQGIPTEIMDSARIDGCSEFGIYYRIVVPVIKPAMGALAIFAFLESWGNFLSPLLFMRSQKMFTLPLGLSSFMGIDSMQYGLVMAGSMIAVVPVLIIFVFMQRQLVAGLTIGAIKS